ncbi:hypothetical protein [Winogradskyella flava]|uniref:DUF1566 domain-containing protein n=1 Tax=Winogradskyella flava TaxID=1884876 RepID=A0A842IUJ6_9FLAO|nr:hypothetical protein [Winogradskyella flava]MBC2844508.1 hypothetical protein [Winogradskyella flava]
MNRIISLSLVVFTLLSCSDNNESEPISLEIGQFHEGGMIFYLDDSGQHGLVAAQNDQATHVPWSCQGTFYNVTAAEIGFGSQNTLDIITNLEFDNSCSPEIYAAKVCQDLILENYSDWFLPSFEELNLMQENRLSIGNFENWFYWSSSELDPMTESDQNWARVRFFGPDNSDLSDFNNAGKGGLNHVRAIRAF